MTVGTFEWWVWCGGTNRASQILEWWMWCTLTDSGYILEWWVWCGDTASLMTEWWVWCGGNIVGGWWVWCGGTNTVILMTVHVSRLLA